MKLVIANRGEIACRILKAAKQRGYAVAVIATEDDLDSLACQKADHVIVVSHFLNGPEIVKKSKEWNANLIHPGYGFLSENAEFAKAVEHAQMTFVGPTWQNMKAMGSKESAKKIAIQCHVPTLEALFSHELLKLDATKWKEALDQKGICAPYLVKASGGGGGRGMRVVEHIEDLKSNVERASEEALAAFADNTVFVERYVKKPRHIEIQVFGDGKGHGVFFGERECSLQRRHQKVIEECPSSVVTPLLREKMGHAALSLVKTTQYRGAGTVEFLLDQDQRFYFLEMNTRLQVEHPVTELAYGIDLVHAQFDLAEGFWPKGFGDPTQFFMLEPTCVALEARILAEDPKNQFLPTPGAIAFYQEPNFEGIRVDSGVTSGSVVHPQFDSMVAKLIAFAPNRLQAVEKLNRGLESFVVLGCTTNLSFLKSIAQHPDFLAGQESTSWIADHLEQLNDESDLAEAKNFFSHSGFLETLVCCLHQKNPSKGVNKIFSTLGEDFLDIRQAEQKQTFFVRTQKKNICLRAVCVKDKIYLHWNGHHFSFQNPLHAQVSNEKTGQDQTAVYAPMAGKVFDILIEQEDLVEKNQVLFILESMKMQLEIRANASGKVQKLCVEKGQILKGPDLMAVLQ